MRVHVTEARENRLLCDGLPRFLRDRRADLGFRGPLLVVNFISPELGPTRELERRGKGGESGRVEEGTSRARARACDGVAYACVPLSVCECEERANLTSRSSSSSTASAPP